MSARAEADGQYRRRVGAVRPSHLMFTGGVGALVDLPNFSVLVRGLDDWSYSSVPNLEPITEPRLLAAVARRHRRVTSMWSAPWLDGVDSDPNGEASRVGVPVEPFPAWLRCTACNELAALDSRVFAFKNDKPRAPHEAKFVHEGCTTKKGRDKPLAVAARFLLACTRGHLDDFPYAYFVHYGAACPKATHPKMRMEDRGGNIGANVAIQCVNCGEQRNMRDAMGSRGKENLPRCRGRHPHLGTFDPDGCAAEPTVLVVGASNQWFAQTLSVLAVPRTGENELRAKVEEHWDTTFKGMPSTSPEFITWARETLPALRQFAKWSDAEVSEMIGKVRESKEAGGEDAAKDDDTDLRKPEWDVFSAPEAPEPTADFTLRRDPDGVPAPLRGIFSDVVQAERLREVRALTAFTRLDAPDPDDPDLVAQAPLSRSETTWVPASEVRGEGVFLRVGEDLLTAWEKRVAGSDALGLHRDAYRQFRMNRYSDRLPGGFDPMRHWPGSRYIALHTLSHLLIRGIAAECGYSAASLSERIYAGDEDDPRGGILIYTAVPDAEGTLGGLVSQAEPERLVRLVRRALGDAMRCSSDPLCAERLPQPHADFLHGAACHVCLFVSETTCERGNRFLDRRFVVPIDDPELALYREPVQ
ncbi:DUF1998 domain-containing protein [Streptomonospora salina]|uniref:MrfA-like Zn-binding domain-containing protein n=1 Tax=Streptomonospora salina TaxID=104205 RepID=A0A841EBC4_9ACTN|nr:DUF1998 domain-containing protein [Streptomonospora salina]MBB5999734.1 hypothetical protein [Streptomonospora salina]